MRLHAQIGSTSHPVLVGTGVLGEVGSVVPARPGNSVVVTDRNVSRFWLQPLMAQLASAGSGTPGLVELPTGEEAKSFAGFRGIVECLEDRHIDREGCVVALGGGTVGDVGGFAASTWHRGIRCVHVPSTLLAMVDSSIGGKTGINTALTKNAIGTFWQPHAVVSDLELLLTLPERDYLAAFAEVVKYGMVCDARFLDEVMSASEALRSRDLAALQHVVVRCVELKLGVVSTDERDTGRRAVLNYGHTVAHAVEAVSRFTVLHGEAVAVGMRVAVRVAAREGLCADDIVRTQDDALHRFGLGRLPVNLALDDIVTALERDKKARERSVRWVLVRGPGEPELDREVPHAVVRAALEEVLQ